MPTTFCKSTPVHPTETNHTQQWTHLYLYSLYTLMKHMSLGKILKQCILKQSTPCGQLRCANTHAHDVTSCMSDTVLLQHRVQDGRKGDGNYRTDT